MAVKGTKTRCLIISGGLPGPGENTVTLGEDMGVEGGGWRGRRIRKRETK